MVSAFKEQNRFRLLNSVYFANPFFCVLFENLKSASGLEILEKLLNFNFITSFFCIALQRTTVIDDDAIMK